MRRCVIRSAATPLDFQACQRASCASLVSVTWAATGFAICRVVIRSHTSHSSYSLARGGTVHKRTSRCRGGLYIVITARGNPMRSSTARAGRRGDHARAYRSFQICMERLVFGGNALRAALYRKDGGWAVLSHRRPAPPCPHRFQQGHPIRCNPHDRRPAASPKLCNREQQSRAAIRTLRACKPIMRKQR
jgi:hypothetical protein